MHVQTASTAAILPEVREATADEAARLIAWMNSHEPVVTELPPDAMVYGPIGGQDGTVVSLASRRACRGVR